MRTSTLLTVVALPLTIAFATPAWAVCGTSTTPCEDFANLANNGVAVYARGNGTSGTGLIGEALQGGTGLYGYARNGGKGVSGGTIDASSIGVYGSNSFSTGWAGYFAGRLFATSGFVSSDARLKKDIADMRYGLDQIMALRPVTFRWKADAQGGTQLGLIAQEVAKVVPEIVDHGNDANPMFSVNYTSLVPVLIKGMQEQEKTIKDQQKVIQRLETRMTELERARRPGLASLFSEGNLMGGIALGLLPLGLVVAGRRRREGKEG